MVYEYRYTKDFYFGTLSTAAAVTDTVLASADFSSLSPNFTTTTYLPIVLLNPATKTYEVVWLTAHAAAAETATVVRAREATEAQAWPAGTQWIVAPTIRDVLSRTTAVALPADPHLGMRVNMTDKGYTAERTWSEWAPSAGVALAEQIGPRRNATNPPTTATLTMRAGHLTGVTDASGQFPVTYRQPFTTATVMAVLMPAGGTGQSVSFASVPAETANGFTAQMWRVTTLSPYATVSFQTGVTVPCSYLAIGY